MSVAKAHLEVLPPGVQVLLLLGLATLVASPTAHREAETAKAHRG